MNAENDGAQVTPRKFVTTADAAKMLNVSVALLKHWRAHRAHLRFFQPGGRGANVMYDAADIEALIERSAVEPVDLTQKNKAR